MVDDLARMAALLGLRVTREDLEQWAPLLQALFGDLERLTDLPIEDREPAFGAAGSLAAPPGEER